jgi:hypothetical protein
MNLVATVVLALLLAVTPITYIDRVFTTEEGEEATALKDVKWDANMIPNHIIVNEDVIDLAYSILDTTFVKPCWGDCPEVIYKGGEIFFFTFNDGNAPGVMYRTSDVPNMYKIYSYEWSWYNFEVKGY